jgi:hypothetical protein
MRKLFTLISVPAMVAALLCNSAQAWDNCGHGYHRDWRGLCQSNYGPTSGCRPGYHIGWDVHRCLPDR